MNSVVVDGSSEVRGQLRDGRRRGKNGWIDEPRADVGTAGSPRSDSLAEKEEIMMCRAVDCPRRHRERDAAPSIGRRKLDRPGDRFQ